MKKTCRGCVALQHSSGWVDTSCAFNYPRDKSSYHGSPLVECPKPLTNSQWLQCENYIVRDTSAAHPAGQAAEGEER